MNRRMLSRALIEQEKRAATLFVILLLTVIFAIDFFTAIYSSAGYDYELLTPYILLYLLIPVAFYFSRRQDPRYIKYIYFFAYLFVCFVIEIAEFRGSSEYSGGNIAEVYFILFSPLFINKRYSFIVISGVSIKYLLIGLLLQTSSVALPIALTMVFALVAIIILSRFIGYIKAMNTSYFKQFEGVVKGIVSTVELKDPYTRGHSERVAEYAVILAKSINIYAEDDLKLISYACLLHDVGKVHIPDFILTKPSKLTEEEYAIVQKHPIVGANAIKNIEGMELCLDIVLYHHERWDGKGYPEGLKEMQIPITARIAAIADCFDAMTSHRSYRGAMTGEQAYEQIIQGKEIQFDPALVEYFIKVFPDWKIILEKNSLIGDDQEVADTAN